MYHYNMFILPQNVSVFNVKTYPRNMSTTSPHMNVDFTLILRRSFELNLDKQKEGKVILIRFEIDFYTFT